MLLCNSRLCLCYIVHILLVFRVMQPKMESYLEAQSHCKTPAMDFVRYVSQITDVSRPTQGPGCPRFVGRASSSLYFLVHWKWLEWITLTLMSLSIVGQQYHPWGVCLESGECSVGQEGNVKSKLLWITHGTYSSKSWSCKKIYCWKTWSIVL